MFNNGLWRHTLATTTLFLAAAGAIAQAQTPTITELRNLASGVSGAVAPGEQINIVGSNLGDSAGVNCSGQNLPTTCGGVSVMFNGKPAPTRSESATSVVFQVPVDVTGTTATVQVNRTTGGQAVQSAVFNTPVALTAPGLQTSTIGGVTLGLIFDSSNNQITPDNVAHTGDLVRVQGTGFGVVNPVIPSGSVTQNAPTSNVVATVRVTVGGKDAVVSSATLLPNTIGFAQVIFRIPTGSGGGNQPVVVTVGGKDSNSVLLAIALPGPGVRNVVNSASNAVTGLPNAGVAPGSILVAYGVGMGPDTLVTAPGYPWPKTLSGTSAKVTVNGQSSDLLLYYTSALQIAGLLPSSTPAGTGTIQVTYNGQTGSPAPIVVTQTNFGVYTVPQNGSGPGIVTFPDYSSVSQTKAANPGDTLIIWGTGLGPVTGDEASGALPGDMPNLPVQVWVGGVSATVVYRGRSGCCVGEDQIAFVVPDKVVGCSVPLAIQINNQVSNYSTMAIAASGRTCTTSLNVVPPGATLAAQPRTLLAKFTRLLAPPSQSPGDPSSSDDASVSAVKLGESVEQLNVQNDSISVGSCLVLSSQGNQSGGGGNDGPPVVGLLDAGPSLVVKGPAGSKTISKTQTLGQYSAHLGNASAGNFLDPGGYTLTSAGGADVGPISTSFTIPNFVWTNRPAGNQLNMNRAKGQTITWTGADPNGYIEISGGGGSNNFSVNFSCLANASDGTFTIPPSVLLAMPVGGGSMTVTSNNATTLFANTGLDLGLITNESAVQVGVQYQ
jgi:uncharacterized protein (TIGR03437 family)